MPCEPVHFGKLVHSQLPAQPFDAPRHLLAYFAGSFSNGRFRRAFGAWATHNNTDRRILIHERRGVALQLASLYGSSEFCLSPSGWAVWSIRTFEAAFYGCIPVVVSDESIAPPVLPFERLLNYDAAFVRLPRSALHNVSAVLRGVAAEGSGERLHRMRANLSLLRGPFCDDRREGAFFSWLLLELHAAAGRARSFRV